MVVHLVCVCVGGGGGGGFWSCLSVIGVGKSRVT